MHIAKICSVLSNLTVDYSGLEGIWTEHSKAIRDLIYYTQCPFGPVALYLKVMKHYYVKRESQKMTNSTTYIFLETGLVALLLYI